MGSRRRRNQLGESLLESLLSIAMLSTVVIGAYAGMATTLRLSVSERNAATASTVLRTVAEGLQSTDLAYVDCPGFTTYPLPAPAVEQAGFTVRIASVKFRSIPLDVTLRPTPSTTTTAPTTTTTTTAPSTTTTAPSTTTTTTAPSTTTTAPSTTTTKKPPRTSTTTSTTSTTTTTAPSTTTTTTTTTAPSTTTTSSTTTTVPVTTTAPPPAAWTVEFQSTCPTDPANGSPADYGLQQIQLDVVDPAGVSRSLTVLKRRA